MKSLQEYTINDLVAITRVSVERFWGNIDSDTDVFAADDYIRKNI